MNLNIDEFLSSYRMTDGAKIVYLHLIRMPGGTATGEELVEVSGRGPASISRWTRQLAKSLLLDIKYNGPRPTVYVARPVKWILCDKPPEK